MSQTELADAAGVRQQLISQIERGENASTKKLPEIAAALNCRVEDIDPKYGSAPAVDDPELMRKFNQIVGANDEEQLRRLDEYLDFLLARSAPPADGTQ